MSFYDVDYSGKKHKNKGRLPGAIVTISGLALVWWFATDAILVWLDARVLVIGDVASLSRMVVGIVIAFVGILVWKGEELTTIKP